MQTTNTTNRPTAIASLLEKREWRNTPNTSSTASTIPSLKKISPTSIKLRQQFGDDPKVLLEKFKPQKQVMFCRDVDRCFFGNAPQLGALCSAYGRDQAQTWLEIQLIDLSEFAGCRDKLTSNQISQLAEIIINTCSHLKLTELMLFFQRFKACDYGRFYGSVDPMVITGALTRFKEQRSAALEKHRMEQERREQAEADRLYDELKQRYRSRVPDAFTERASLTFLQYRLCGFDCMDDDTFAAEFEAIRSGTKPLPPMPWGVCA